VQRQLKVGVRIKHRKNSGSLAIFAPQSAVPHRAKIPRYGRMYAGRGHTTPSTSENDVVIKKCNLIEIKFF